MATIQKRNDRWRAIVRRTGCPVRTSTFSTKSAAKTWALRTERELEDWVAEGSPATDHTTVEQLIQWYIETRSKTKPVSTTERGNLKRLAESFGHVEAVRLTSADILNHVRRRRHGEHRAADGNVLPKVKGATMNVELSSLQSVFSLARSLDRIKLTGDPIAEARPALRHLRLVSKSHKRDRRPTLEEIRQLKEHFAQRAERAEIPMVDIIDFALTTAKRQAEITRLLWSDLDEHKRIILLRDVKNPTRKEGNHKLWPLLGEAFEVVKRQPRTTKEVRIFPYNPDSISAAFTRACTRLKIDDLHFHDLRHEATSRLFEQGYDIPRVAAVTLHENWTDLKRYTQIKPESLHRNGV